MAILWFNEISFLQMFQTALSFEPSFLWICHQPSQARRFSSKQNELYSIQFLSSSRTRSVNRFSKFLRITRILAFLFLSEIPKKVFHDSVFKFHGNRDIKNLKDQDLDYLVWTMLLFKKISIVTANMWQWDHEKYCWSRYGLHTCTWLSL